MFVNQAVCFTHQEGQVMFVMPKFNMVDKFKQVENEYDTLYAQNDDIVVINLK